MRETLWFLFWLWLGGAVGTLVVAVVATARGLRRGTIDWDDVMTPSLDLLYLGAAVLWPYTWAFIAWETWLREPVAAGAWLWTLARRAGETRGEALLTLAVAAGTGSVQEATEAYRLEELTAIADAFCPHTPQCLASERCRVEGTETPPCPTCETPHFPRFCDLCGGHACRDHECEWDDEEDGCE